MKSLAKDPLNIVVCGIGGQGNILASELLGSALVEQGFHVAVGETYGASQRGGSVMSHIRVSLASETGVLIGAGQADVIVGFEPLETLRIARVYGHAATLVIYDPRAVYPMGVLVGEAVYPPLDEMVKELSSLCGGVYEVPAAALAQDAGNAKAANIALIGALSAIDALPLTQEDYRRALTQRFTGAALELNTRVFALGRDALLSQREGAGA